MAPHITVVPASTRVGTETIRWLLASSEKPLVRGIYRDTSKSPAEYTNTYNFEAVKGDVEIGDVLDFTGSDAVLYVPPPTYEKKMDLADWARQTATNVKDALHRASVKRLVILSGLGSRHDRGVGLACLNHETDQILKDAVPDVTILQCTHFLEEFKYIFQAPLGDPPSIASWIAPADYKIPMVSITDVGETCAKYLLTDSGNSSFQRLKIFGPRPYSSNDLRDAFEEVTGKKAELSTVFRTLWRL
ncbi:NAD(P)-binding domain [Fusarium oxysporum f. sp. vasinfectum]|nr:NAD(P)-binding domain [Fusarium oxysporum f. sp. vasinfectum]